MSTPDLSRASNYTWDLFKQHPGKFLLSSVGSGDNAKSILELGGQALFGIASLNAQRKAQQQNYKLALKDYLRKVGEGKANFKNTANNFAESLAWRLQSLADFGNGSASQYANTALASMDTLNSAAKDLGIEGNPFASHINNMAQYADANTLQKYNGLVGNQQPVPDVANNPTAPTLQNVYDAKRAALTNGIQLGSQQPTNPSAPVTGTPSQPAMPPTGSSLQMVTANMNSQANQNQYNPQVKLV